MPHEFRSSAVRRTWAVGKSQPPPWHRASPTEKTLEQSTAFYSGSCKLAADLYAPDDLAAGEQRPGVVLCCGYTGVKNLYLDEMARRLAAGGYAALTFDYKGWGQSEGPPLRLA